MAEGKPITYGFERPYHTFIGEIILFLISSMAFYLACNPKKEFIRNNLIQKILVKVKFYEINPPIIWAMGLIGVLIKIYNLSKGGADYGDVIGKFLEGLEYLMFAPICLLFPSLLTIKYSQKRTVYLYCAILIIINIASNKRHLIITPIGTIAVLFLLYLIFNNLKLTKLVTPLKLVLGGLLLLLSLTALTNLSTAMLHTRSTMLNNSEQRKNGDKLKAFEKTLETLQNESLMKRLNNSKHKIDRAPTIYHQSWTEDYLENFMLARYANLRITDQTIYYAEKIGYGNTKMQEHFKTSLIALFPSPILKIFGIHFDKSANEFSRGDLLSGRGLGGYKITSHLADGLATFNLWYFPIQLITFFLIFKLLNSLVIISSQTIIYAPLGLMDVFGFLGKFRNANGITNDFAFLIRGFIQSIVTYLIIYHLIRFILKTISKNYKSSI
ncbi:MAG: hypothetical protein ABJJ05_11645 [Maribacter litoralis]|uniref:hypothetical protein n=1 Tax=Maribacter litoralis TaxID=2059726 RepID=UPI003299A68F